MRNRRVAHPFSICFLPIVNTEGAPSFAFILVKDGWPRTSTSLLHNTDLASPTVHRQSHRLNPATGNPRPIATALPNRPPDCTQPAVRTVRRINVLRRTMVNRRPSGESRLASGPPLIGEKVPPPPPYLFFLGRFILQIFLTYLESMHTEDHPCEEVAREPVRLCL